ncbi:hypothetical protein GJ744_001970 [Endocarpon pusillum]|uniref:Zn(2)-C6 fungal-type domain-containing protein n=1 Tax=Endocarpon pusillum TaxID=364733 RepID=A0A8H7AB07_9EURO|nr:hypothetical protein GJ744_001970 [Endocarpon pusillum]
MAAGSYDDQFPLLDETALDEVLFGLSPGPMDSDPNLFHRPLQASLEASPYQFVTGLNCNSKIEVPPPWAHIQTASSPSSSGTPLPPTDLSSNYNGLSRQISSESKRKSELLNEALPNKRSKSAYSHTHSTHTAMNRKTGACLPCQMRTNKHGCVPGPDQDSPCQACLKKAQALGPVLCRRARFQDVKLIRLGPSRDFATTLRWLKRSPDPQKGEWKKLTNISVMKSRRTNPGYTELRLSQGHSKGTLNLRVQEFDPVESDKTGYQWSDNGITHVYRCPHFAIADRDHAADQVRQFIDLNSDEYVDRLLPASSEPSAAFVRMAFQTALNRAQKSSLLAMTIKFWVAGRLIEDPWSIQGQESLGMKLDSCPASPFSHRIPVPPIMDFQIDNIVIFDYLMNMLDCIRKAMKQRIMPIKKEDWFDIHLATFVLLQHVDLTMKHDVDFALSHNLHKRFSNRPLIEMVTFGANALLSFHQHEKGHFPLSAPKWADVESSYTFDETQKNYLLEARRLIQQIQLPQIPGNDLFWTSQVYDRNWQPATVEVF